jgi:hypothetical protein
LKIGHESGILILLPSEKLLLHVPLMTVVRTL